MNRNCYGSYIKNCFWIADAKAILGVCTSRFEQGEDHGIRHLPKRLWDVQLTCLGERGDILSPQLWTRNVSGFKSG